MTHEEIIDYLKEIHISHQHFSANGAVHRCPCCGGNMITSGIPAPAFSSRANVLICGVCCAEEVEAQRSGTWDYSPERLKDWWCIKTQETAGSFPSDPVHFHIMDPEVNDDKTITFLCECWFDQAKKFGLDPAILENEDTWLNVYLTIHPQTEEISLCYTVDDNDKNECFVYVPTKEDREAILNVVHHYCQRRGESLQDIVDSVLPAVEEQEFEIPVKEINYGVAKIRAASLEAALEKVQDAYGTGNIEWGKTEFDFTVPMGGADCG